jgi:hypothetical protein
MLAERKKSSDVRCVMRISFIPDLDPNGWVFQLLAVSDFVSLCLLSTKDIINFLLLKCLVYSITVGFYMKLSGNSLSGNSNVESICAITKFLQETGSLKTELEDHAKQVRSYELTAKTSAGNLQQVTSAVCV